MSARLVILVVVAGALAIAAAMKLSRPPQPSSAPESEESSVFDGDGRTREQIAVVQQVLSKRPLPGAEPEEEPDLHVRIYPDPGEKGKKRLKLEITESHGYYVESFNIRVWHKKKPDDGPEDSDLVVDKVIEKYLKANDTLVDCLELVPIEMSRANHDLGTEEDWEAKVLSHGRARAADPAVLPMLAEAYSCE